MNRRIFAILLPIFLTGMMVAAAPPRDPTLRAELLRMVRADQEVRAKITADPHLLAGPTTTDRNAIALIQQGMAIDRRNTARMAQIVAKHGWPGKSLVGEDGSEAAFLLVQHADQAKAFQKRCLPLLKTAADRGEARKKDWAYLTDRVLLGEGKPQIYGTGFQPNANGELVPLPIYDEANVDARRKSVGLPPLAEYKRMLEKAYPKPAGGAGDTTKEPKP